MAMQVDICAVDLDMSSETHPRDCLAMIQKSFSAGMDM